MCDPHSGEPLLAGYKSSATGWTTGTPLGGARLAATSKRGSLDAIGRTVTSMPGSRTRRRFIGWSHESIVSSNSWP